jgi:DNA (cytosine-5)-methyltransferase 1
MGLERGGMSVVWANDIEPSKAEMYRGHFGDENHLSVKDIAEVKPDELPPNLSLAWASFPCVDVSLAGWRAGLNGERTGTFWHFVRIIEQMGKRRPPVVALENVTGLATSNGGRDLADVVKALNGLGYSVDILVIDARYFVPQSRPRLFIIGALRPPETATKLPGDALRPSYLGKIFSAADLRTHRFALPEVGPKKRTGLAAHVQRLRLEDSSWWENKRVQEFTDSLSPVQASRLSDLRRSGTLAYRTAYKRTRNGVAVWEMRADEIAGCLRTAGGGSSKQAIVRVDGDSLMIRWMTGQEYANLMGAANYKLDQMRHSQVASGFGDAVCVDVVEWLSIHYLCPLLRGNESAHQSVKLTT